MKLQRSKFSLYLPLITIPTGWAALGFVVFSNPGLVSILDVFTSSPQGNLRKFGVISIISLAVLVISFLTIYWIDSFFISGRFFSFISPVKKTLNEDPLRRFWLALLLVLSLLFLQLSLTGKIENYLDGLFFSTIQPLFIWAFLFAFLSFLIGLLPTDETKFVTDEFWKLSGVLFILFFSVGLVLQLLGYGFTEQSRLLGNFELTGYPIVGYQVFFAAIPALLLSYLVEKIPQAPLSKYIQKLKIVDVVICLILFITAAIVWKAYPIQPHMFYDKPRPPNFEYYPNSDSNTYDRTALNLLTAGKLQTYTYRFDEYIGRRPYLALYYAGLHKLTNSNYPDMIAIQQVVFSSLPVLIYLLTSSLHSRPSGVLAGLLVLIRERNGLLLSDTVTGVQSQLLMSEIPTMLVLILFLLVLNNAILKKSHKAPRLLLAGGILGIAMQIRQEVGILLPAIAVGMLLINRKRFAKAAGQITLLLAGLVLIITPWMIRNWNESGKLYFDVPGNKFDSIYRTLGIDRDWWKSDQGDDPQSGTIQDLSFAAGEPYQTGSVVSSGKTGSVIPAMATIQEQNDPEPDRFELIANHFTNQLVQSVVYLPSYPLYLDIDFISKMMIGKLDRYYGGLLYSPQKYVKELPYWWTGWSGKVPAKSLISVVVAVYLIASGVSAAWKKERSAALNPLLSYLGYILIYSLVRASGGRFLQEIDWIALVYFSIGTMETLSYLIRNRGEKIVPPLIDIGQEGHTGKDKARRSLVIYSAVILGLLTAGSLPVILERSIPSSYPDEVLAVMTSEVLESPQELLQAEDQNQLVEFISREGTALVGKAYYPRYFKIGENLEDIRPEVLGKMEDRYDYQRTEFYLIGSDTSWVLLKNDAIPDVLPNGSEVFVIGCQQDGIVDAVVVAVLGENGTAEHLYWRGDAIQAPFQCPLQSPMNADD